MLNTNKEGSFVYRTEAARQEAPVIKTVDSLLEEAVLASASDIHIEPLEKDTRVRLRIDGLLRTVRTLPLAMHNAIVSRIKILSEIDIAEKRLPQDGRLAAVVAGRSIDLRVSTLPTVNGEKVVLRILDKSSMLFDLEHLGFSPVNAALYQKLYAASHGMILATGPTGSGKSTTLYATLQAAGDRTKNIITIEDPVEYKLEGVNQVAVNNKAGLTFANGLRSILRQDPDIIMVGEIRDEETARLAVQAALTGHLVFSTLHTNNAVGAITRLLDMGIEPFLVAAALRGVIAQRLVRCVCPYCAAAYEASAVELAYLNKSGDAKLTLRAGKGCSKCNFTGYTGRTAVYEVMPLSPSMQQLIVQRAGESELTAEALAGGATRLSDDAAEKVMQGKTTVAEFLRTVYY